MLRDMATNGTQPECSWGGFPQCVKGILIALCIVLVISLGWNIFFVSKRCSGKRKCCLRKRRSQSSRHMEDNPIYGNLNYIQADVGVYTEADLPRLALSSSSLRNPQRLISDTQSKNQDCYANLTLKAPRVQSGRSSPQIHFSDVVHLEEPTESEREEDVNTDAVSTMSDLYASVQNQRTKSVDLAEDGEGYANHL